MSRSRKDILETESMLQRLTKVLEDEQPRAYQSHSVARADAESLRRISMTLHRWSELECGTDSGCIERGHKTTAQVVAEGNTLAVRQTTFESDEAGAPYWANHGGTRLTYTKMADREAGAKRRLAKIMARYPGFTAYIQGDPRGCALYILRPGDAREGETPDSCYSRGLAVHR